MTLKIATCLWKANQHSKSFSTMYDETWVEKLYRGFKRNLTVPFDFICFTDQKYTFREPIVQVALENSENPDYGCMIEPFQLEGPLIIVGLDTIVVGNIDHLARYCEAAIYMALPRDPYKPERSINGVALVPDGHTDIFKKWHGENDMAWLRKFKWQPIDDLWPNQVVSLKAHDIRRQGLRDSRIVYFHGNPKPNELTNLDWVKENWK